MRRSRFLVVGEAIVDVIEPVTSTGDVASSRHPGGSPTNVAVGLARLGHPVQQLCTLGADRDGDLIRAHLAQSGVALHPASPRAEQTSVASVSLVEDGDARYDFAVTWDAPAAIDWTGIDVVHTGSIAVALEPGATGVIELLRSRPQTVRVAIDPNVRSDFFPAGQAAVRLEPYFALADLVKLSSEDAAYLYSELAHDQDALISHILSFGPLIVALTLGGGGAVLASRTDRVRAEALADRVIDTVGAGDSFMAGLLDGIATPGLGGWEPDRADLQSLAEHASRAAAITVGRRGADLPWHVELYGER